MLSIPVILKPVSPTMEVMQVDFEHRIDFQQPTIVDRSNTRVIGHLLQSRARRSYADISRTSSQVSHIERVGSIKPVYDDVSEKLRRARQAMQKRAKTSKTSYAPMERLTEAPTSATSPNAPFTTIALTPVVA